jgi:hypothetical protein
MPQRCLGLVLVCFSLIASCGRARHNDDAGAGKAGSGAGARAGAAADGGRGATPVDGGSCCQDEQLDAEIEGQCDATGTWKIDYEGDEPCGPGDETLTLSSDDDSGTADVTFQAHGPRASSCGPSDTGTYAKSVVQSRSGCVVTLSSHAKWCSNGEPQCEDLELVLRLDGDTGNTAKIDGTFRRCWCRSSGPEGTRVMLGGTATRRTSPLP